MSAENSTTFFFINFIATYTVLEVFQVTEKVQTYNTAKAPWGYCEAALWLIFL